MINALSSLILSPDHSPTGVWRLPDLPYDLLLNIAKNLSIKDVVNLRKTCRGLFQFSKTRSVWATLGRSIQRRRAVPLPVWRSLESLSDKELENAVCQAARIEINFLKERPTPRPIFQVIDTGHRWGHVNWLGQVPGGQYIIIFFRNGVLSVWDVASETYGCVAWIQTHLNHYTHTCEVLQDEQAVLIGLATGAHDTDHEEHGQFSVFRINFPPLHPTVSIAQVLEGKIDIPITGLFLARGLAGVVGRFHERTAALQVYDWKTHRGILLDTGIELETDCDLDVIPFPEEIILYAEDSKQSLLYTYTVENIRHMLSSATHHRLQTGDQPGGGLPSQSGGNDSSSSSTPSHEAVSSSEGSENLAIIRISLPPKRSCRRNIQDKGVGAFGAGYTMLKRSHQSARDELPCDGRVSVLTMSLRQLDDDSTRVRCLTHHFLTPLASPSSDTGPLAPANPSVSSPNEPLDDGPVKHTFAHTLGLNAIAKGPTGYDLVSFGEGGTNAVWLARADASDLESDDGEDSLESHEYDKIEFKFWVATFPTDASSHCGQECVRKLQLPRMISPKITAALDLDDTQGVLCIATTHGEVFRLRFD